MHFSTYYFLQLLVFNSIEVRSIECWVLKHWFKNVNKKYANRSNNNIVVVTVTNCSSTYFTPIIIFILRQIIPKSKMYDLRCKKPTRATSETFTNTWSSVHIIKKSKDGDRNTGWFLQIDTPDEFLWTCFFLGVQDCDRCAKNFHNLLRLHSGLIYHVFFLSIVCTHSASPTGCHSSGHAGIAEPASCTVLPVRSTTSRTRPEVQELCRTTQSPNLPIDLFSFRPHPCRLLDRRSSLLYLRSHSIDLYHFFFFRRFLARSIIRRCSHDSHDTVARRCSTHRSITLLTKCTELQTARSFSYNQCT